MRKRGRNYMLWLWAGVFFLATVMVCPLVWAQPLSLGKVELQGNAAVNAGKGLAFQAPRETEAPLMQGANINTGANGKALVDWTDKGSMVLDENSSAKVTEDGFELMKGKMTVRLNPGQVLKVKALDKIYTIKAPPGKVAEATILIKDNAVKTAGAIFFGGGGAAGAGAIPGYVGPALLAGATVGGVAAVASSESNKGGGPASPSAP